MAGNRAAVVLLAGAVCLGFSLGRCGGPEQVPHTRIVTVPTVKTHVEYRDRYFNLPDSCTRAVKALGDVTKENGHTTESAGVILDALDSLGQGRATGDIQSVNKAIDKIRPAQIELATASNDHSDLQQRITVLISRCEKEVKAGP
jgi:hypothetical protein